jgi:hypothetical protein
VPYGGSDMCTIDAATLSGIFDVYGPAHLTLHNLRLTRSVSPTPLTPNPIPYTPKP